MRHHHRFSRSGFTMMELAVVLAIIGLIVGGIITGQNLSRAQKIRTSLTDALGYEHAAQLFNKQYGGLPGDLRDAQRLWGNAEGGSVDTDCVSPTTVASGSVAGTTPQATCNGDGDGRITVSNAEVYRAWQQLWAAGLIQGTYTGISYTGASNQRDSMPGVNVPAGSLPSSGYSWDTLGIVDNAVTASTTYYDGDYDNVMLFGRQLSTSTSREVLLTGKEGFEADRKIDDGFPALGNVRNFKPSSSFPNCAVGTASATAVYNKSYNALPACPLIFMWSIQSKTTR